MADENIEAVCFPLALFVIKKWLYNLINPFLCGSGKDICKLTIIKEMQSWILRQDDSGLAFVSSVFAFDLSTESPGTDS